MFGYQSLNKPSGSSEKLARVMKMHKNYDVIIAPSRATATYFAKGFNYPLSSFEILGLPRIDFIRNARVNPQIAECYPQILNKKNVVYAPTFRKGRRVNVRDLEENFDFNKYNLIVKLHPLDRENLNLTEAEKSKMIIDERFSTFEWIKIAEKVITDYSALGLESALLDKEIYFYIYDIDEYEKNTGLNMKFSEEPIGRYVYRDARKLVELMSEPYERECVREFREKYFEVDETNCTKKFVDYIRRYLQGCK